ncbi:MAG TPA: GNAT family N-acetyltransferase [Puia sp.]|nr:GNAT family N-acetyltransferase [Puia sp.]
MSFIICNEPLFIKPLYNPDEILFSHYIKKINRTISIRSCNLTTDVDLVYEWVNLEYALRFWQLDGDRSRVYNIYYNIQRNSHAHSFIGVLDYDPICQIDIYRVLYDEIHQYILADKNTCGFHLLMAPNEKPIHGLTTAIIQTLLQYYFSFPEAAIMYGEPDINNLRSNKLLQKIGFRFIQAISMSYKTANLYSITKQQFHEKNKIA